MEGIARECRRFAVTVQPGVEELLAAVPSLGQTQCHDHVVRRLVVDRSRGGPDPGVN